MKQLLILTAILLSGLLIAGCSTRNHVETETTLLQADSHNGLMEESDVRYRRKDNIKNLNRRMMIDDWDSLWLYRRSSMLTPHVVRLGH